MSMRFGVDRRVLSVIVAFGCSALVGLVLAGGAASAAVTHKYLSQLTGFENPTAIAVDSAGEVYVVDTVARTVDRFSSTGVPLAFSASGSYIEGSKLTGIPSGGSTEAFTEPHGVAVDDENGLVYVSAGALHVVDVFSSTGEYLRQLTGTPNTAPVSGLFQDPYGMTVDQVTHRLYVTDPHSEVVDVFSSTGVWESQFGSGVLGAGGPYGESVAVNELTGNAYVGNSGPEVIDVFESSGGFLAPAWTGAGTPGGKFKGYVYIGMDPTNGHVYLAETGKDVVNEFDASTAEEYVGQLTGTPGGAFGRPQAIAVDPVSKNVYVADENGVVDVFGPDMFPPNVTTESVSNLTTTSVTLNGTVNPLNQGSASCQFEYGTSESYDSTVPCSPAPGSGNSPVAVSASLAGLTPGTAYHYRLVATNANGTVSSVDQQFRTMGAKSEEWVEDVLAREATIRARINPNGTDATYHFEYDTSSYDTTTSHGTSVLVPDTDIGSGTQDVSVSSHAKNLQPETTYHYRVVVVSEIAPGEHETFDGADKTFTTFAPLGSGSIESCPNEKLRAEQPYGLGLPNCRAYEMVSPLDKDDNNIVEGGVRASVSGDAVVYASKGSFAEPASALTGSAYVAKRGSGGWSTKNISPHYHTFTGNGNVPFNELFFTPDLSKGLVHSEFFPLTSGSPEGYINLYVADLNSGSYEEVGGPNLGRGPYRGGEGPSEPKAAGVSTDLSHVVFDEGPPSRFAGTGEGIHVYEWAAGSLSLVDVAPEGQTFSAFDQTGSPGIFGRVWEKDTWHAVSADGLRVFFTAGEGSGEEVLGQVYVREVGLAKTVEVSASQRTVPDPGGPRPARYWDASADGSKVFFTSRSELTDDANTGPADNAANLYEYDLNTGVLSDLTVDNNVGDAHGAAVLGLVNAAENGSYVYFVAEGSLAPGATSGRANLYIYHAGTVKFIAMLAPATSKNVEAKDEDGGDSNDWAGAEPQTERIEELGPGSHTARVTSDGKHLAFQSERSLTGYDNVPAEPKDCETVVKGEFLPSPCREVYVYDVDSGALACASCDPNGASPTGSAVLGGCDSLKESVERALPFYLPRNLSDDGVRLFFESPDALVPHDSNGRQDVYEYENGHVYAISDVAGSFASYFLDASTSGDDVFIGTADQLLPADTDSRLDLYDVRVGGGDPVSIAPPACDNGDSCKAPVSPQPGVFGSPASATFAGAGNLTPVSVKPVVKTKAKAKRCKGGSVKRHGVCVRKKAKRSVRHSKKGRK
jgi:hypothetical protein